MGCKHFYEKNTLERYVGRSPTSYTTLALCRLKEADADAAAIIDGALAKKGYLISIAGAQCPVAAFGSWTVCPRFSENK